VAGRHLSYLSLAGPLAGDCVCLCAASGVACTPAQLVGGTPKWFEPACKGSHRRPHVPPCCAAVACQAKRWGQKPKCKRAKKKWVIDVVCHERAGTICRCSPESRPKAAAPAMLRPATNGNQRGKKRPGLTEPQQIWGSCRLASVHQTAPRGRPARGGQRAISHGAAPGCGTGLVYFGGMDGAKKWAMDLGWRESDLLHAQRSAYCMRGHLWRLTRAAAVVGASRGCRCCCRLVQHLYLPNSHQAVSQTQAHSRTP
jgi:hypothetical protein